MPISPFVPDRLTITLGDAAGIGPEVTLKALARLPVSLRRKILLLGPAVFYQNLAKCLGFSFDFECHFPAAFPKKLVRGASNTEWTRAAVFSIELAARLSMRRAVGGIVTAPINKGGLKKAGFDIPGHTEFLADLSKTKNFDMMLIGSPLRVVTVTRHAAIKDVPRLLSKKKIEASILLADNELRRSFGIKNPRIVVCGLNPHAGEEGRFGTEEIRFIRPAVESAKKKTKSLVVGPLSPDALFYDAYKGKYDATICMYHDQGLIPLKMISRGHGVNVTLGLPFVRTSPDHGTAYDIAPKFSADAGSMAEAILLAFKLIQNRKKYDAHRRG